MNARHFPTVKQQKLLITIVKEHTGFHRDLHSLTPHLQCDYIKYKASFYCLECTEWSTSFDILSNSDERGSLLSVDGYEMNADGIRSQCLPAVIVRNVINVSIYERLILFERRKYFMKKAMKQSTMVAILNAISSILLLTIIGTFILVIVYNNRIDQANQDRFDLTYNANRFLDGSTTLTAEVRAYAATGDRVHYDNYWDEINNQKNREIGLEHLRKIGITAQEEDMISQMSSISNQLVPLEENAMSLASQGQIDEALSYVYGNEYQESVNKINTLKASFLDTLDQRTAAKINHLDGMCSVFSGLLAIYNAALLILQGVQTYLTKKKLLKPILTIKDEMVELSSGNLSSNFLLEPDTSEIGMLIGTIHQTKKELKKYIDDISAQLSEMAKGNMDLQQTIDYVGDFKPIQKSLEIILDSMNHTLTQIDHAASIVDNHADKFLLVRKLWRKVLLNRPAQFRSFLPLSAYCQTGCRRLPKMLPWPRMQPARPLPACIPAMKKCWRCVRL